MICKCGHDISRHDKLGCLAFREPPGPGSIFCECELTQDDLREDDIAQLRARAAEADALRAELKRTDALLNKAADGEELATLERDYRPRTDEYERVCEERDQLRATVAAQAQRIEAAREIIKPFAELGDVFTKQDNYDDSIWTKIPDDDLITCGWRHLVVRVRDFRAASAWLAANAPTQGETESEA